MATASFIGRDDTTGGNWLGVYGREGYFLPSSINDGYPKMTPPWLNGFGISGAQAHNYSNAVPNTWKPKTPPFGDTSKAIVLYTTPLHQVGAYYTVNIDTATQPAAVSFYVVDFDDGFRQASIEARDFFTNDLLATATRPPGIGGSWLKFNLTGNVNFRIVNGGPGDAQIAAIAYDLAEAPAPAVSDAPYSAVLNGLSPWMYWKLTDAGGALAGQVQDVSGNGRHGQWSYGVGTFAHAPYGTPFQGVGGRSLKLRTEPVNTDEALAVNSTDPAPQIRPLSNWTMVIGLRPARATFNPGGLGAGVLNTPVDLYVMPSHGAGIQGAYYGVGIIAGTNGIWLVAHGSGYYQVVGRLITSISSTQLHLVVVKCVNNTLSVELDGVPGNQIPGATNEMGALGGAILAPSALIGRSSSTAYGLLAGGNLAHFAIYDRALSTLETNQIVAGWNNSPYVSNIYAYNKARLAYFSRLVRTFEHVQWTVPPVPSTPLSRALAYLDRQREAVRYGSIIPDEDYAPFVAQTIMGSAPAGSTLRRYTWTDTATLEETITVPGNGRWSFDVPAGVTELRAFNGATEVARWATRTELVRTTTTSEHTTFDHQALAILAKLWDGDPYMAVQMCLAAIMAQNSGGWPEWVWQLQTTSFPDEQDRWNTAWMTYAILKVLEAVPYGPDSPRLRRAAREGLNWLTAHTSDLEHEGEVMFFTFLIGFDQLRDDAYLEAALDVKATLRGRGAAPTPLRAIFLQKTNRFAAALESLDTISVDGAETAFIRRIAAERLSRVVTDDYDAEQLENGSWEDSVGPTAWWVLAQDGAVLNESGIFTVARITPQHRLHLAGEAVSSAADGPPVRFSRTGRATTFKNGQITVGGERVRIKQVGVEVAGPPREDVDFFVAEPQQQRMGMKRDADGFMRFVPAEEATHWLVEEDGYLTFSEGKADRRHVERAPDGTIIIYDS